MGKGGWRRYGALLIAWGLCWLGGAVEAAATAAEWSLRDGGGLPGEPLTFDAEEKTVYFRDPLSERQRVVPTRELSLRSRQRLLCSPVFHLGGREEGWLKSPSKRGVILKATIGAGLAMSLGYWVMGWCLTGRRSLFLAVCAFVGSWLMMGLLVAFYAFLKMRISGGSGTMWIGGIVSVGIAAFYLSAVYACQLWKGFLILFGQLVIAFCLLATALAGAELIGGPERTEAWWNTEVFEPIGLTKPASPGP